MTSDFNKWLLSRYRADLGRLSVFQEPTDEELIDVFENLPNPFKQGVYLEYHRKIKLTIDGKKLAEILNQ